MNTAFIERRAEPRKEFSTSVKYKVLGENNLEDFSYEETKTKNISKSGLCIISTKNLTEGSVIRVELLFEKGKKIRAFCEVQWCRFNKDLQVYEAGLSFIALRDEDVQFLNNIISQNQSQAM